MPMPPQEEDIVNPRPSLSVDWELYAAMLEESDMPLGQQKELIETLWSIVVMFVDLGFELDPVRQICGQDDDGGPDEVADLVSLLGDGMGIREEEQWQE